MTMPYHPHDDNPLAGLVARGVRFAQRAAIAFALALLGGIAIGAALTDSLLAQIFVTVLAAIALWVPMLALTLKVGRKPAPARPKGTTIEAAARPIAEASDPWRRLALAAPHERERIDALKGSIGRSRTTLGAAQLDPDAHDLCVLIDKRLPELIERSLEDLPPDDRGRRAQVGQLIDLVEQFARHCGRKREADTPASAREAEILRRRFEDRLGDDGPFGG